MRERRDDDVDCGRDCGGAAENIGISDDAGEKPQCWDKDELR